jgi:regulation of enolase protein 1 (concanavalin A-like superfamily)
MDTPLFGRCQATSRSLLSSPATIRHCTIRPGLYLRADERHWIKAGIEYTDGMMHFSVVVTDGVSDWSVIPLPDATPTDEIAVRLTRHGDAVRVQFSVSGAAWQMARLCPFQAGDAEIGVMACSPQREGFHATFRDLTVGPPIPRDLHAD